MCPATEHFYYLTLNENPKCAFSASNDSSFIKQKWHKRKRKQENPDYHKFALAFPVKNSTGIQA